MPLAQADQIRQTYAAKPDLFLNALRARPAERGLRVEASSLSHFYKRYGIMRRTTLTTRPRKIGRT